MSQTRFSISFPLKGEHPVHPLNFMESTDVEVEVVGYVKTDNVHKVFRLAQNFHDDWAKNAVRSMSVGDFISDGIRTWMVEGMGLKLLTH